MKCGGLGEASAQACFELAKKLVYHVPRLIWKKPGLTQGRSWSWGSEVGPQPSFQLLQQGCSTPLAAALVPFPALRSEWIDRGNGEISSRS